MFEAIARRQLEKEVAGAVQAKRAPWCFRPQAVQDHLLEVFPKQQANVQALCRVITSGAMGYLMSLPEPDKDQEVLISLAQRIPQDDINGREVLWAVQCWAAALGYLPHAHRVEIVTQLKAQVKAQAEAAAEERRRVQAAAASRWLLTKAATAKSQREEAAAAKSQREAEEAEAAARLQRYREEVVAVAEARRQRDREEAEVKKHEPLLERWRLAFPREAAAIEEAARLASRASQARMDAEIARIDAALPMKDRPSWDGLDSSGYQRVGSNFGPSAKESGPPRREKSEARKARDAAVLRLKLEEGDRSRSAINAEILRRIKTTPDQEALHRKMDAAWQAELQRRQAEEERQREEERQQLQQKVAEERRVKIEEWRKQFPLQCAGLDDEEVLRQINAASASKRFR